MGTPGVVDFTVLQLSFDQPHVVLPYVYVEITGLLQFLNRVIRVGLTEKGMFGQRFEGCEGVNHVAIGEQCPRQREESGW